MRHAHGRPRHTLTSVLGQALYVYHVQARNPCIILCTGIGPYLVSGLRSAEPEAGGPHGARAALGPPRQSTYLLSLSLSIKTIIFDMVHVQVYTT